MKQTFVFKGTWNDCVGLFNCLCSLGVPMMSKIYPDNNGFAFQAEETPELVHYLSGSKMEQELKMVKWASELKIIDNHGRQVRVVGTPEVLDLRVVPGIKD